MNLRLCAIAGAVFVLLLGNSFLIGQDRPSIEIWPKGLPAGSIKLPPAKVKDLKEKEKASSQGSLARSQGLGRVVGLLFLSWVEEGRQRTSALPSPERHGCRKCVSFELRYLRTATKALIVKDHDIDNETAALAAWDRSRADAGQGRTGCANSCARGRQTRPTAPTATC